MNDWTFGKIWQNLIILNGREEFRAEHLKDRFTTQQQRLTDPRKVVNLKTMDGNAIYKGKIFHLYYHKQTNLITS